MHKLNNKKMAALLLMTLVTTGCATSGQGEDDDRHAATKTGAIGGALLGLTLGALTGDASLAAKGAVAGGVAGGVAGSTVDLENKRENKRSSSRDDAIAQVGNNNQSSAETDKKNWQEVNHFMGDWHVAITSNITENSIQATASAKGVLVEQSTAQVKIDTFMVDDKQVKMKLTTHFSYSEDNGYSATISNNEENSMVEFSGEYQAGLNRYNFYPTTHEVDLIKGVNASNIRLQLGFAGKNVWMVETYATIDGKEQQIQSYRFTKKS